MDVRGPGLGRPGRDVAARRRDQDPGRDRRRADVHRGRAAARAAGRRAAKRRQADARCVAGRRRRRCGTPAGPRPPGCAAGVSPDVDEVLAAHPLRELVTGPRARSRSTSTASARCTAPGTSSSRAPRAPYDEATGKVVSPAPSAPPPKRLDAVAAMGFDVIYLPPIHPIGEVNRKGPNNTLTAGPDDPGSPWAIGSRRGRPRRDPPRPRHDRGLRRVRGPGPRARPRGRPRPGAAGAPRTTRGSTTHPEWFTTPRRRHIAYAENPPKKYQDIYPINFDNDPDGHLRRGAADRPALDGARRADLPGRQPAHQAGGVLGVAARRGPQDRPRRALPGRGVHPAGDDARARRRSASTRLHLLHLAQRQVGARGLPHRAVPRDRRDVHAARTSSSNTPDILHAYLQYGGPAGVQDPGRRWPPPARRPGACTPATSCSSTSRSGRAARSTSTPRSTRSGSATGTAPRPRAARWRRTSPGSTRSAARHPALQQLRNLTFHNSDDDATCWSSPSGAAARRPATTTVLVVVNLDPHGDARDDGAPRHARARPGLARPFAVHDELTGDDWTWGEHNYVRLDPYVEPAHILTVAEAPTRRRSTDCDDRRRRRRDARDPTGSRRRSSTRCWSGRSRDSNGDGIGDFKGLTEKLDYLAVARRRLPLGAAVLHLAAARRRLRRRRLHRRSCPRSAPSRTSTSSSTRRTSAASG